MPSEFFQAVFCFAGFWRRLHCMLGGGGGCTIRRVRAALGGGSCPGGQVVVYV